MCYSQSGNFPDFVILQSSSSVDYYPWLGLRWTVYMKQWEEIVCDCLEATDNWLWYLSCVCSGPADYSFMITPHLAWWWDTNKRSLDQLKIPLLKIICSTRFKQLGKTNSSEMKAVCVRAYQKIKDHLCLLVCKIMWGDIDNKTNLFSIRKNIFCRDSWVFSEAGLDYSCSLAFKVSFNNTASLAGVKSTRPPNTHCHILSVWQMIPFCLCALFSVKKHQVGPCVLFLRLFVCVCIR